MKRLDNESLLFDRQEKIIQINDDYNLLENGYIAFSGGKDSIVLSNLVDEALPNNQIPRVHVDTGMEYYNMSKFVRELAKRDKRIVIIKSGVSIPKMLEEYGYPFKSKLHSHNICIYQNNKEKVHEYINMIEEQPHLKFDYDFIHNLPKGVRTTIKYYYGIRERERERDFSQFKEYSKKT